MPNNNPVQIVLNSQNYVQRVIPQPGGKNTDFYADRDREFIAHRERLAGQIESFTALADFKNSPLMYAHVELQEAAWAKSHRPVRALFPAGKMRTLGANELGSFVVELTADDIPRIQEKILQAENDTTWIVKNNKKETKPSRERSEVGAIKDIRPYTAAERRKFSVDQASKWLEDPRTGGAYYVETFVSEFLGEEETNKNRVRLIRDLYKNFLKGLNGLPLQLDISTVRSDLFPNPILVIKLAEQHIQNKAHHSILIGFLDKHAAVKAILLPPVLQSSDVSVSNGGKIEISAPDSEQSYPVVGIIDTGVSVIPNLTDWQIGSGDFLDLNNDQDVTHGTFIAGLVCAGTALNGVGLLSEKNCKFYDLGLHPTSLSLYSYYYPRGFLDFLEQLDTEIALATELGVRIFNMSLSVTLPVDDHSYSLFANILDQIADKHDVIFVLPAGNLESRIFHKPWPDHPDECLKQLAEYRHQGQDRVFQPADSLRAVAVGALEPPSSNGNLKPAIYTRRGPGPSLGSKPDVSHIGGGVLLDTGLKSIDPNGRLSESRGTSFAAPLVAKTLASLDHVIEGFVSPPVSG